MHLQLAKCADEYAGVCHKILTHMHRIRCEEQCQKPSAVFRRRDILSMEGVVSLQHCSLSSIKVNGR